MSKEDEKQSGLPSSERTLSSTPTLAPSSGAANVKPPDHDHEKQELALAVVPGAPFPEGGLRAWSAVAGAWLVGKRCSMTVPGGR